MRVTMMTIDPAMGPAGRLLITVTAVDLEIIEDSEPSLTPSRDTRAYTCTPADFTEQVAVIVSAVERHQPNALFVESNGSGRVLRDQLADRWPHLPVTAYARLSASVLG